MLGSTQGFCCGLTRSVLVGSVSLLAATAAQAQSVARASAEEKANDNGDIIVTAERREVSLQKSSIAIQVVTAEQLDNVKRIQDLATVAPGVMVGGGTSFPQITIRGIGDNALVNRDAVALAYSADGVVFGHSSGISTWYFDLARIEVVKGPQGTLYGRNSTAGALNLITNPPKLGELSGYVEGDFGFFGTRVASRARDGRNIGKVEAAINIPLGQVAALRVAGQIVDGDGILSDGGQDNRAKSVRARLLVKPSDRLSILINANYGRQTGQGSGVVLYPYYENNPWRSIIDVPTTVVRPILGPANSPFSRPQRFNDSRSWGVTGEMNLELGDFATLTVLPGYRHFATEAAAFTSPARSSLQDDMDQFSIEARLGHDGEHLKWVVGAFHFKEDLREQVDNASPAAFGSTLYNLSNKADAVFGQATVSVVDNVRLIGGIRYTSETVTGDATAGTGAYPLVPFTPLPGILGQTVVANPAKTSRISWKLGVEADIGADSMAFFTVANSFKGAGFSVYNAIPSGPAAGTTCDGGPLTRPFKPEGLTAYTLGLRNRFMNGALQVNAEGFVWKYKNQQLNTNVSDACGLVQRPILNAGAATIKGANIDIVWRLTPNDRVSFFAEYADGKYDSFVFPQSALGFYAPAFHSPCTNSATTGGFNIDCSGQSLRTLPKWLVQGGYSHDFVLGNDAKVRFNADVQYVTERWMDFLYLPNGLAPGYTQINASLGYEAPERKWSVTAYVRNLSNAVIYGNGNRLNQTNPSPLAPNGEVYYANNIAAPRTFGVRGRFNF